MKPSLVGLGGRVVAAGGAIVLLGGCQGDNLAFSLQPITCSFSAPAQVSGATAAALSAGGMRMALQDVVTRVVPSFSAASGGGELRDRLTALADAVGQPPSVAQCLGVETARRALAAIPAAPETAADRVVVDITLDMVAASLSAASR